jgi:hypothetical protein
MSLARILSPPQSSTANPNTLYCGNFLGAEYLQILVFEPALRGPAGEPICPIDPNPDSGGMIVALEKFKKF